MWKRNGKKRHFDNSMINSLIGRTGRKLRPEHWWVSGGHGREVGERGGGGNGWGLGSPGDITLVMLLPQPTGRNDPGQF